jgi:hypothetical protein
VVVDIAVTLEDYAHAAERICRSELWAMGNGVPSMLDKFVLYNEDDYKWAKVLIAFAAEQIVARMTGGTLTEGDGPDRGVDMIRDEITYQIKYNSYPFGGFYPKSGTAFVAERGILVVHAGDHKVRLAGWTEQKHYTAHTEPKNLRESNTVMVVEQNYLLDIRVLLAR